MRSPHDLAAIGEAVITELLTLDVEVLCERVLAKVVEADAGARANPGGDREVGYDDNDPVHRRLVYLGAMNAVEVLIHSVALAARVA